jgi:hypothetical protein
VSNMKLFHVCLLLLFETMSALVNIWRGTAAMRTEAHTGLHVKCPLLIKIGGTQ